VRRRPIGVSPSAANLSSLRPEQNCLSRLQSDDCSRSFGLTGHQDFCSQPRGLTKVDGKDILRVIMKPCEDSCKTTPASSTENGRDFTLASPWDVVIASRSKRHGEPQESQLEVAALSQQSISSPRRIQAGFSNLEMRPQAGTTTGHCS
jgi:hypothetical protein